MRLTRQFTALAAVFVAFSLQLLVAPAHVAEHSLAGFPAQALVQYKGGNLHTPFDGSLVTPHLCSLCLAADGLFHILAFGSSMVSSAEEATSAQSLPNSTLFQQRSFLPFSRAPPV